MNKLFFDIETIPCDEMKKEEYLKIFGAKNGNGKLSEDEVHRKMSFEGTFGRIACIGYIKEDGKITKEVIKGNEEEILEKFWSVVADVDLFIGHNVFEFDLPFIYKRSIILGVKPSRNLNFAKYRNDPIFDTMSEWEKWAFGSRQSLDTLAKVLGFATSKDEMDGSMVWDYFKDGKIEDICKYCMKDVELVRQIYYRMTFGEVPEQREFPVADDINF